jgi:STE24 endopeptidase
MSANLLTLAFTVALVTSLALRLWLDGRQIRHVARHRDTVPADFAGTVSAESHRKAADYTIARQRLGILEAAWGAAVLLGWTLLGGLDALNLALKDPARAWFGDLGYQLALLTAFSLIAGALDLPFAWWRTFRLEQRFGFNRTDLRTWLVDMAKGSLVSALIGLPLAALVLWLMGRAGAGWWLWAFGALAAFTLLMQVLYPTFIAPWFNRFEPLSDASLRERVEALMNRCGFRAQGLYVMDGSRRSAHANAYFTGFGAAKRVVFFDTLLAKLSPGEVEAVLAHELGHFRRRHVLQRMVLMMGVWLGVLALLGWLLPQPAFYLGLGVQPDLSAPNNALALLLVLNVLPVFGFFVTPLLSAWSRRHEFEADAFACGQARAEDLAAALVKLYQDNASTLTPDPLYVRFHYSHPPAAQRLAALPRAAA